MNYGDPFSSHQIFCCQYVPFFRIRNQKILVFITLNSGLTRNAMDFDPLALYLVDQWKPKNSPMMNLTAIDLSGRGHSDYLTNTTLYRMGHHLTECDDVLSHLRGHQTSKNRRKTSWIGTGFGGLIGMTYAVSYYPIISHLVLNDIGSFLPKEYINGLRDFSHQHPMTQSIEEMANELKVKYGSMYDPNGTKLTAEDWNRMAKDGTYYDEIAGAYRCAYDPNVMEGLLRDIGENEDGTFEDWDIFEDVWKKIPPMVKILLIRGEKSSVLTRETVDKMIEINSNTSVVEVEEIGHHSLLTDPEIMDIVAQFIGLERRS